MRKSITALGPSGAKAVRAPRADAASAGCTSMPGHGETGVVYVTERDGGGGRQAGGSSWWGGRSQGFRPRRRRLSLQRGGIAVVAAVRSDPAAVSQCALLLLPHVSTVLVPKDTYFFFPCPFSRGISVADPRVLRVR